MALTPLGDKIFVVREQQNDRTDAGLYIPDVAKEKQQVAVVRAVGPGKLRDDGTREPMNVKVGDRVIISKWGGSDLKVGGEEYLIATEKEIYAIIEEES